MKKLLLLLIITSYLTSCSGVRYGCPSDQWLVGKGGYKTTKFRIKDKN